VTLPHLGLVTFQRELGLAPLPVDPGSESEAGTDQGGLGGTAREAAERLGGGEQGGWVAGTGDVGASAPEKGDGGEDVGAGGPTRGTPDGAATDEGSTVDFFGIAAAAEAEGVARVRQRGEQGAEYRGHLGHSAGLLAAERGLSIHFRRRRVGSDLG
jgi:hypothetical protein